MSRQYEQWIHSQLEPDDKIITGNAKRHKPSFAQFWELQEQERERLGPDEYARRQAEYEKWQQQKKNEDC